MQSPTRFLDRSSPPHVATLILISGLSALAMNIFLPSLPQMALYFDADYRIIQLSVAVYFAATAILQLVIGPLSDKYGRRPVLMWGVGLFLLATLGCIFAPNATIFLLFRMMQAIVSVTMVISRAVVRDMYMDDQAASMIGYVTMGMAIAPMLGPAIGGFLDEWLGWQASFWTLFLLGVLCIWLIQADLGETAVASDRSLIQQFREYPELFRSPRFWGYAAAAALSSGAFFAYLGGAPFVGTELFGLSSSQLGIFFGAPALGYFFGNFLSGRFSIRFGINQMVLWGCGVNAAGLMILLLIFLYGQGNVYIFFGFMTFVGIGNGMTLPNATAGMLSVRPHLAGTAAGLGGSLMIGGGAALSALAGILLAPETGAMPLLWLMFTTAALGLAAIQFVHWRERQLMR
ncbi:MAG: multidrug effflux MFS transporter [Aestuariivita sp.]|nr:multidrug effflux MFS transporter [Aestuariivita sp.]MCY4203225.1 multidrug effflux MFS transporter [Aestuariivita sp.]MCY4287568.1 multidrug effflux MFS transporter [Aestuariivita sp.]MCY4346058.1 multidrug effflux MFS transporter [Aestuariivita sp.]